VIALACASVSILSLNKMSIPPELLKMLTCNINRTFELKHVGSGAFGHVFQGYGYQKLYSIKFTKPMDKLDESDEFYIHKQLYNILKKSTVSPYLSIVEPITEYMCARQENITGYKAVMQGVPIDKQYATNMLSGSPPITPIRTQITAYFPSNSWAYYVTGWPGNPEHLTILFDVICSLFEMFLVTEGRFKHKDIHSENILVKELDVMVRKKFIFPDMRVIFSTSHDIKIIDFGISTMKTCTMKKVNIKTITGTCPDLNFRLLKTLTLRPTYETELNELDEFLTTALRNTRKGKMTEYEFYTQLMSLTLFDNIRTIIDDA
jgi:serine/threonine protein kinase